jgi:glycosyltransferase involved in cell wall biosynthesis
MAETAVSGPGTTRAKGVTRIRPTTDVSALRQGRLRAGVIYVTAFVLVYVVLIVPDFARLGLVDRLARDGSFIVACLLAVAPSPWLADAARRPSDAGLWVLYLSAYVPSIVVPAFVLGSGWNLLPYWLTLAASFLAVLAVVSRVDLRLPGPAMGERAYGWLLVAAGVGGALAIVAAFGLPTSLPSLDQVAGTRNDYREQLAEAGRLAGYAVWWTGAVVAPLLLAFGAWSRRPALAVLGVGLIGLVYAATAFRSMLFILLLVLVAVALLVRARGRFGPWLAGLTTALITVCAALAFMGWIVPSSMLVRRSLIVPGQVIAYYHDFFGANPVYLLSHSILEGFVARPYPETPAGLIGVRYFNDPLVSANGNLWADGIANFGVPGIVVASLLLALVLIALDSVSVGKPALVTIAVGAVAVWGLTNSGILTTLLTHGLLVVLVLLWLLPRERAGRGPRAPVVAHISTVHRSDDPRILLKECRTLADAGYDVTLIAQGEGPPDPGAVRFVSLGTVGSRRQRVLVMPVRVLRAVWNIGPDLVHLHDPELLPVGLLLKLAGLRVVYDAHEDLPAQIAYKAYLPIRARPVVARLAGLGEAIASRLVDGIVAATPVIAAHFPPDRTVLVQNYPLRQEFGLAEPPSYEGRPLLVAYVGRVTEAVGGLIMAEAIRGLRDRPGLRAVIAGPVDPALAPVIAGDAAAAGARPIETPGWLDRDAVVALLGAARVGLVVFQPVQNYLDAQPTKLFEYMASGVPVVASDFERWRDIVAGHDCGLLVDPGDPSAVAAAIDRLLDDPELAMAMGRRGRAAVLERFLWDAEGARLVAFYAQRLPAVVRSETEVQGPALTTAG